MSHNSLCMRPHHLTPLASKLSRATHHTKAATNPRKDIPLPSFQPVTPLLKHKVMLGLHTLTNNRINNQYLQRRPSSTWTSRPVNRRGNENGNRNAVCLQAVGPCCAAVYWRDDITVAENCFIRATASTMTGKGTLQL